MAAHSRLPAGIEMSVSIAAKVIGLAAPDVREILDGSGDAGHAFMAQCAGLETIGRLAAGGADFVRVEFAQPILTTQKHPHVRPKELIRRANQKIAAEVLYINHAVWGVLHGIHINHRPYAVRTLNNRLHIVNRARQVAGVIKRY